jgi:hypothetical protein
MKRLHLLALVAVLGLSACGASKAPDSDGPAQGPEAAALPDVARVVCEDGGTRVETPSVRPQPDGVHLEVVNNAGSERALAISNAEGGGAGIGVSPGTSTQIVDVEPGALTVACNDPATEARGGEPLEVVDEDGVWVPTRLGCEEQFSQVVDYIQGAQGETNDPLEAARKAVESYGLEPDDVFERAGYPETELAKVRLVRSDEVLVVVDLVDDGTGKWLLSMITGCSSLEP